MIIKEDFKDLNLFMIDIEGLDVAGKETFSKSLTEYLESMLDVEFNVTLLSFPTYESPIGQEIKRRLMSGEIDFSINNLYADDRYEVITNLLNEFKTKYSPDTKHIIICDRFALSNTLYGFKPLVSEYTRKGTVDSYHFKNLKTQLFDFLYWEYERLGLDPDMIVLFNRPDKESAIFHNKLIEQKLNKDSNENVRFQAYLQKVLDDIIKPELKDDEIDLIEVAIGSNFNKSVNYEIMDSILLTINNHFASNNNIIDLDEQNDTVDIKFDKNTMERHIDNLILILQKDPNPSFIHPEITKVFQEFKDDDVKLKESLMKLFIPSRGSELAAGFDVRYLPDLTKDMNPNDKYKPFTFNDPFKIKMIPTHLILKSCDARKNKVVEIQIRPRSGMTLKKGLLIANTPATIDMDYRSHCQILMYALPYDKPQSILVGERIGQFIVNEIPKDVRFNYTHMEDITKRGTGGFGSTDIIQEKPTEPTSKENDKILKQMIQEEKMR